VLDGFGCKAAVTLFLQYGEGRGHMVRLSWLMARGPYPSRSFQVNII